MKEKGGVTRTVLDVLREAFPYYYMPSDDPGSDHEIDFPQWGATIYIHPETPNIARILVQAVERRTFPNGDRLLAYVTGQLRRSRLHRYTTRRRDEYHFGPQHVDDLIEMLSWSDF